MAKQLTIHQLLEDPVYATWIAREAEISVFGHTPPWLIYALKKKKGPWLRAEVMEYKTALTWMMNNLDKYYDIVIVSRRQAFHPPIVKKAGKNHYWPTPPDHIWCTYCRRPTRFRFYTAHHAFPARYNNVIDEYTRRCSVCGVRLSYISTYTSRLVSRWSGVIDKPKKKGKK